jgi:hypothetical protein
LLLAPSYRPSSIARTAKGASEFVEEPAAGVDGNSPRGTSCVSEATILGVRDASGALSAAITSSLRVSMT